MRQALNSNPMVQLAVVGILVVVVGLFLMMNLKKKSGSTPATAGSGTTAAASSTPAGTAAPAGGVSATPAPATSGVTAAPPTTGSVTPAPLVPGPGLPRDVVKAWKGGDAVVLLVVRGGGIDDRLVRRSVDSLSRPGLAVFVTRAKDVARYSRITQGVGVDRAPALVVVRPRKESGPVPEAQVSYGFRSSESVVQAVHDALYQGPDDLPYSPR